MKKALIKSRAYFVAQGCELRTYMGESMRNCKVLTLRSSWQIDPSRIGMPCKLVASMLNTFDLPLQLHYSRHMPW